MIYLGRGIPDTKYEVGDYALYDFLDNQPHLDSFTIWKCEGYWRGNREQTIVIEVFDTEIDNVKLFMKLYKVEFNQQGVYLKKISVETTLI
jgi:hypothetical protein